jgi:hypothetical protein
VQVAGETGISDRWSAIRKKPFWLLTTGRWPATDS